MFPYSDDLPRRQFPVVTFLIIFINVGVFLKYGFSPYYESFIWVHGLIPGDLHLSHFITSMFLHAGLFHLIFNMWYLWLFGDNLENRLGWAGFLGFYLLGGAVAFVAHVLTTTDPVMRNLPCIGASGAVSAVMGGYLTFFPEARIKVFVFLFYQALTFKVSASFFLGVWFLQQVLNGGLVFNNESMVAYGAHLGGFFFGVFAAFIFKNYILTQDEDRSTREY